MARSPWRTIWWSSASNRVKLIATPLFRPGGRPSPSYRKGRGKSPGPAPHRDVPLARDVGLLLQARLPLVQEPADVAVGEVEVGQVARPIDRLGEIARLRRPLGQLEEQVLAAGHLPYGQVLERFLEVALGQPPVVARLERQAQVEQRLGPEAGIGPGG